jgi:diguanylate cyclase (GGDEF)-like protein
MGYRRAKAGFSAWSRAIWTRGLAVASPGDGTVEAGAPDSGGVRELVRRSWARARDLAVPAGNPGARYVGVEPDCPLVRAARPVLSSALAQLRDAAVVAILTDANGLLLHHLCAERTFERQLMDAGAVGLGSDFAEETIGTNGVGTALAVRHPVQIEAGEHYAEAGNAFSCGAAPVRDAMSGDIVGLVNFTCPAQKSSPPLLALASSAAAQIERELLLSADSGDLAVLTCSDDPAVLRGLMTAQRRRHALRERLHQIMMRAASQQVGSLLPQIMDLAAVILPVDAVWVLDRQDCGRLRVVAVWGDVAPSAVGTHLPSDVAAVVAGTVGREQVAVASGRPARLLPGQRRETSSWLAVAGPSGRSPVWPQSACPPPPTRSPSAAGRCIVVATTRPGAGIGRERGSAQALLAEIAVACDSACRFEELSRLAVSDALTGLPSRRHFLELAQGALAHCQARGLPMAVLMVDVDRFKHVNDTFGHSAGDRVLAEVSARIQAALHPDDVVGRIGGEEIAAVSIVPRTEAVALADGLRRAVADREVDVSGRTLRMTVSVGVACLTSRDRGLVELLDRADEALYAAKKSGRNRVVEAATWSPAQSA